MPSIRFVPTPTSEPSSRSIASYARESRRSSSSRCRTRRSRRSACTPEIADLTFYAGQLQDAIIGLLTPWSRAEGADIGFGGRWHKAAIVDFVESHPYVDFVKDFEMYHKPDIELRDEDWSPTDQEVVEATTSRSILVSHSTHLINPIP